MQPFPVTPVEVEYPQSDGKPMGESDLHRRWMVKIIERLERHYTGQRVYVSGNLIIYYEQGNPRRHFSPDAFVIKDCDPGDRLIFKVWEERRVPDFVVETTSHSTRREDTDTKPELYARLGIPEYFLFDPTGDWLKPPLLGYRLRGANYVPVEPDEQGLIRSEQLGLLLRLEDGDLEMYDPVTELRLLTWEEAAEQALEAGAAKDREILAARTQAEAARIQADRAQQEIDAARSEVETQTREAAARLQEAQEARRREGIARRQEEAAQRDAAAAKQQLALEAAARQALEEELARLKAKIGEAGTA